jgi:hypothetical protein
LIVIDDSLTTRPDPSVIARGRSAGRLTVRAEVINVFDDAAFFGPRTGQGLGVFAQLGAAGGFPRTLQLMARMAW